MTIDEIMLRDMMEAERADRAEWRRDYTTGRDRRRWNALEWCALALAVATLALLAWCCVSDAPHVFNSISR